MIGADTENTSWGVKMGPVASQMEIPCFSSWK